MVNGNDNTIRDAKRANWIEIGNSFSKLIRNNFLGGATLRMFKNGKEIISRSKAGDPPPPPPLCEGFEIIGSAGHVSSA